MIYNTKNLQYSDRYDVYYDGDTGEFQEIPCTCNPEECRYSKAYIEDGFPQKINI